jgi:plasmid stabilization system protein ParE
MNDLDFLTVARAEYASAANWYANQSVIAADRFATEVEMAIDAIRKNPTQYARWDDRYRFYLLDRFPYYVAYRCEPRKVVIVAVVHTSRDSAAWTDR